MDKDSHTAPVQKEEATCPCNQPWPPVQEPRGRRERELRKQNLSLQLSLWGQEEGRGKGATVGESKASPHSEGHGEKSVGAIPGQSGSVLVPARDDGNSVY